MSKENYNDLKKHLKWARKNNAQNKLKLEGSWMYDNEYFSSSYLHKLIQNEVIVINSELGKKIDPKTIDVGGIRIPIDLSFLKNIAAKNLSAPWYYKGEGKLMTADNYFNSFFKIKNSDKILDHFPKSKKILGVRKQIKDGDIGYGVHADWWGIYFLKLAAMAGKEFGELTFKTKELCKLREFLLKEKPKGCVLSYVTSDKDCPIYDIDLSPVLNQFDGCELDYLKLIFASKAKVIKTPPKKTWPKDSIGLGINPKFIKVPYYDGKVEWVLAYAK